MKKRMKKIIALTMIATMAVSLVAGCGKKEEEGKTKDGKIHLRFATWDDGETLDSQQECVDKAGIPEYVCPAVESDKAVYPERQHKQQHKKSGHFL